MTCSFKFLEAKLARKRTKNMVVNGFLLTDLLSTTTKDLPRFS
jgi:hypothetical protein